MCVWKLQVFNSYTDTMVLHLLWYYQVLSTPSVCVAWFIIWRSRQRSVASVSQCPTNQIVKKFNVRDAIWLVKKILFTMMLITLAAPASYCEPCLRERERKRYCQFLNICCWHVMYTFQLLVVHVTVHVFLSWSLSLSSQGGTGQCFSRTDVKIEYSERRVKPPCLEHAQAALTRETYRSKFYSLLYHEEEFHSSILANRYHLSNTVQLGLYVDQQPTIYHYC